MAASATWAAAWEDSAAAVLEAAAETGWAMSVVGEKSCSLSGWTSVAAEAVKEAALVAEMEVAIETVRGAALVVEGAAAEATGRAAVGLVERAAY